MCLPLVVFVVLGACTNDSTSVPSTDLVANPPPATLPAGPPHHVAPTAFRSGNDITWIAGQNVEGSKLQLTLPTDVAGAEKPVAAAERVGLTVSSCTLLQPDLWEVEGQVHRAVDPPIALSFGVALEGSSGPVTRFEARIDGIGPFRVVLATGLRPLPSGRCTIRSGDNVSDGPGTISTTGVITWDAPNGSLQQLGVGLDLDDPLDPRWEWARFHLSGERVRLASVLAVPASSPDVTMVAFRRYIDEATVVTEYDTPGGKTTVTESHGTRSRPRPIDAKGGWSDFGAFAGFVWEWGEGATLVGHSGVGEIEIEAPDLESLMAVASGLQRYTNADRADPTPGFRSSRPDPALGPLIARAANAHLDVDGRSPVTVDEVTWLLAGPGPNHNDSGEYLANVVIIGATLVDGTWAVAPRGGGPWDGCLASYPIDPDTDLVIAGDSTWTIVGGHGDPIETIGGVALVPSGSSVSALGPDATLVDCSIHVPPGWVDTTDNTIPWTDTTLPPEG